MKSAIGIILLGVVAGTLGQGNFVSDLNGESFEKYGPNECECSKRNQDIQNNDRSHLEYVNRWIEDMTRWSRQMGRQAKNWSDQRRIFSQNHDRTIWRSCHTGRGSNGQIFIRNSEERIVNGILRHTNRIYYPATRITTWYGYTVDLGDPNAEPVLMTNRTRSSGSI